MNPLLKIPEVGRRYLGIHEITENRAPGIAQFWTLTSYKEGERDRAPWCCAFVVYCVQIADRETSAFNLRVPPRTASVAALLEWAREPQNGCLVFEPDSQRYAPRAGDLLVFLPHFSHVGIVVEDYDGRGAVQTVEGNTNQAGSREGDGVYSKTRGTAICGHFIRLPSYPALA